MARIKRNKVRRPLILIGCEGTNETEQIYFSNFSSRNCTIKFSTGNSTDPKGLLEDIKNYMYKEDISSSYGDKIFLVIDTDLDDGRINKIKNIEKECNKLGIKIITSSPTFEIWYLMHYRCNNLKFSSSKAVKVELRKVIAGYKESMNVYDIIKDNTVKAIENAKKIEKLAFKESDMYSFTPHSYVYMVIEEINNNIKKD